MLMAHSSASRQDYGADEDRVQRLMSNLSLKGKELFAVALNTTETDKRKRPEPALHSFHKEFKNDESDDDEDDDDDSDEDDESLPSEIYDGNEGNAEDPRRGTVPGRKKVTDDKNRGAWSPEQDDALRAAVERHQGKNWKAIAREVPGNRTHIQCLQRWGKVLKPGLVKGPWTDEEDDLLRKYVPYEPKGNWVAVSQHIPGRTAKQCRERWSLCLDPSIRKDPWTPEEDELLLKLHDRHGNAWALIAKQLPGRTENATKSRFKSIERKRDRAWTPTEDALIIRGKADEKKWSAIAASLDGSRTKHAVKMRWKDLMEGDPTLQRFNFSNGTTSEESLYNKDSSDSLRRGDSLLLEALPPPIGSSPGYNTVRPEDYQYTYGFIDATNETGANWQRQQNPPAQQQHKLPHSLSSDKLLGLRVGRNESFEEWLAKEAGGINGVLGTTGNLNTYGNIRPFEGSAEATNNLIMSPSGVITFNYDGLDGVDDLDIV